MQVKHCAWVLLSAVVLQGCPSFEKVGAQGSSREISVFYNVPMDSRAYQGMEHLLSYSINTVREEQFFILDPVPFSQFRVHRLFKNQVFLVDLSLDDEMARKVPGFLGERGRELMRSGEPFRLLVRDSWALGQTTLYLVGRSEAELVSMLENSDPQELRRQFEESVYQGLTRTLFNMGEQESLTRQIARDYGWHMRMLPEYSAVVGAGGDFVKFDSQDPVRLILVHWKPGELPLTEEAWRPVLDRILDTHNDKDYVSDNDTQVFLTEFQGRPAIKWEGVWQNDKYVIGGAFRAYGIHRDGLSFLLIIMVYNPAGGKVPSLIQTEAILRTFDTVH